MNDYVGMEEFTQRIMGEVIERSHGQVEDDQYEGNLPDFIENSFTQMMFDYLSDSGVIDDAEVCYFQYNTGSKTTKINGYSFDEERGILNIFVSLYYHVGTLTNVQSDEIQKACDQASEFYSLAIKGHHIKMEQASDQFDMVQRLYEVHDSIDQVRIHVLTNGLITQDTIDSRKIDGNVCKVLIHDLRQLHECIESGLVATIGVDFEKTLGSAIPCVSIPHNSSDYSTYLAIIPGIVFYELYDEYGTQLLELNVRAFLQTTGKVNRGIRETLQNEGNRFLAYNNGISITAEHIELSDDVSNGQAIVSIHGLQIVNGGQTMGSIYRAKKSGESDLKQVFVPVKITVINPDKVEEIVPKISRFSNTQNRVSEADFSSRDPFHVEIQRLSESIWIPGEQSRWFYERARGGYYETKARNATTLAKKRQFESVVPTSQKFTKTDLAKYINSWDMIPDVVSLGAQKNFIHF
ncbi:AIPR family protein, partial [bacterium]|nr:AIPR family protein [bacterium]